MDQQIKIIKRILILGATTRIGRQVVKRALKAGLQVNVLVDDLYEVDKSLFNQVLIFTGDPTNHHDLGVALIGCDSVISALNISRIAPFPWSRLNTPNNLLSATMQKLIPLCRLLSVGHVIIVSAWGAGDSRKHIPGWYRWVIDHSNLRYSYNDHELQEELIRTSGLDFTIVRPAALTNSKRGKSVLVSINGYPKPNLLVGKDSVAKFIVSALNKTYNCQTLVVSEF